MSIALGGCLLPSVDLFGAATASASDAGTDAPRDATTDAALDSPPDGSPPFDCVGAAFCATFDTSADVAAGWTGKFQSPGALLTLDTARFVSSPAGFLSTTPVGGANDYLAAALYKNLPRVGNNVFRWRFAARVAKLDPSEQVTLAELQLPVDAGNYSAARLWVKNGTLNLEEEAGTSGTVTVDPHEVPNAWKVDQWMQFEVNVDVAKRQASLERDGALVVSFGLTSAWSGPAVVIALGVYYSSGTQTGNQVVYDDTRLDWTP